MTDLYPLEEIAAGKLTGIAIIALLGLFCLWRGWVLCTGPLPRFIIDYRGWSNTLLALPYSGVFFLLLPLGILDPPLPRLVKGLIGLIIMCCLVIGVLGFFVWFPTFLVPRWYRRALKAGIARDDYPALLAFKTLPTTEQRTAASRSGGGRRQ